MGIHIHRAMGWGGTHPDGNALSERLWENPRAGEVAELMVRAREKAATAGDRVAFMADMPREGGTRPYPSTLNGLVHCVCGPDGSEADSVWIVAPPGTRGAWYRRDDDMDYHTRRWSQDWETADIQWLATPPYPYEGWCWEDSMTGRRARPPEAGEETERPLRVVPPASIRVIAEELGFPDWRALKPVIATWWR